MSEDDQSPRRPVEAHCTSGRIEVSLLTAHDVKAETVTGQIVVTLPPDVRPYQLQRQALPASTPEGYDCIVIARSVRGRITAGVRSRLARAKRKIRASRVPLRRPAEVDLEQRVGLVLIAIRLAYAQGRRPGALDLEAGAELRHEAIRLARLVVGLTPESGEAWSLLALLLLSEVRAATATDSEGVFVPLADQDRSQWDPERVDEGHRALRRGRKLGLTTPLQFEAEISAHHTFAGSAAEVDWAAIRDLYRQLLKVGGENSGVELNMAVAVAEAGDPATALDLLDKLEPAAVGEPWRVHAARAHVHQIAGDSHAAHRQWRLAAQTAPPTLRTQLQLRSDQ